MTIEKVKTKDGTIKWELRFYMNGRNSTRVMRRFDTRVEAEAFYDAHRLEKKDLKLKASGVPTFGETDFRRETEHWLKLQSPKFSRAHLDNVKRFLDRILPAYGNLTPDKFHPGLLSKIQSELSLLGLKAASVNRYLQIVATILNFSAKQRRIPYNPTTGFQKLKEVREGIGYWERDEAMDFLSFVDRRYPPGSRNRWIYVVYLIAINTAARAGEIWALRPSDLQLEGEVFLIQRQYNKLLGDFAPTKARKPRKVPCNRFILQELKALIQSKNIKPNETIFQNTKGYPVSHDNFAKRQFANDLKKWGGKKIRFHDLRHTATTLMMASGVDLKTVKEICGHDNVKTTMNYIHLLAEKIRDTARTFAIVPETKAEKVALKLVQN